MINFGIGKKNQKKFWLTFTVGLLTLIILAGSFLIYHRFTSAGSTNLYPGNCLGTWQNPDKAQGRPDASDTLTINKENSAVFSEGGIKEIYCGSFNGDLSESEIKLIKSVNLKFSWLVTDEELKTATSSIIIIQPPATSSEEVVQNTDYIVNQILNNINADEVQLIISTTTPEITIITNPVSATENAAAIAPISETIPSPEANSSVSEINTTTTENNSGTEAATSSPTSFWWRKFSFFFAEDTVSNLQQETALISGANNPSINSGQAATSSLDSPLSLTEDFLKVSYTLDGVSWQALGMVNKNNWQDISFQIPVYQLEDIKKIQIKIESLPLVNKTPYVYLDGLALEVEYETSQTSQSKAAPILSQLLNPSSGNSVSFSLPFSWEDKLKDLGCNGEEDHYWGVTISPSNSKDVYISNIPINEHNGIIKADIPVNDYREIEIKCSSRPIDLFIASHGEGTEGLTGDGVLIEKRDPPENK